jgi:hypothetical protein
VQDEARGGETIAFGNKGFGKQGFGRKGFGGSGFGKKWSPGFSLGYRVGFQRGWNGSKRAPGAHRRYNGQRRRYEFVNRG